MTAPQPCMVTITRRIAPGRTYVTEARFITPEQLRAEHARALHEEWRHFREQSVGTWHEEREEETA